VQQESLQDDIVGVIRQEAFAFLEVVLGFGESTGTLWRLKARAKNKKFLFF
jgi:hypothetical protein